MLYSSAPDEQPTLRTRRDPEPSPRVGITSVRRLSNTAGSRKNSDTPMRNASSAVCLALVCSLTRASAVSSHATLSARRHAGTRLESGTSR